MECPFVGALFVPARIVDGTPSKSVNASEWETFGILVEGDNSRSYLRRKTKMKNRVISGFLIMKPGACASADASVSKRPRSPWQESRRSSCIACDAMEPTSFGQGRRLQLRRNNVQEFRRGGTDVPVGTVASVRSTDFLRTLPKAAIDRIQVVEQPNDLSAGEEDNR